jgi:predicted Holliday junction resolvase-like endonuclease
MKRFIPILISCSVLLVFFSLPAFCQTSTLPAKIELKSSVDRSTVPLNENLNFTIQVSWEGEQSRFMITPVAPPQCDNLEISGSSSLNESKVEEGKTKSLKTFQFVLKPLQTGTGRIGSVQIKYIDNITQDSSSLSTQPVSVQITPATKSSQSGYKTVLVIAIILILIYVIYSSRRKVRKIAIPQEQGSEQEEQKPETPEEKALKRLNEISEQLKMGRSDDFSRNIYKLLTGYLETKYQIVTSGKTTNDIVNSLSNLDLSPEKVNRLKEILTTCDMIKFAKEGMEKGKLEQTAEEVRKFLEQKV